MREERLIQLGRVFRLAGFGAASRLVGPSPGVRIFVLHGVEPNLFAGLDAILTMLRGRGRILDPDALFTWLDAPAAAPLESDAFVISFDDGLASSYRAARQVLAKHDVRALFFVPTAVLDLRSSVEMRRFAAAHMYGGTAENRITPAMYEFMTADALLELRATGHAILPHTHSHCYLTDLVGAAKVEAELVQPKRRLEALLGEELRAFAFPGGTDRHAARAAYRAVRSIYDFCFTGLVGRNGPDTHRHYLCRDGLHPHYPLEHVRNMTDGVYDPYYALRMRRLKAVTR